MHVDHAIHRARQRAQSLFFRNRANGAGQRRAASNAMNDELRGIDVGFRQRVPQHLFHAGRGGSVTVSHLLVVARAEAADGFRGVTVETVLGDRWPR